MQMLMKMPLRTRDSGKTLALDLSNPMIEKWLIREEMHTRGGGDWILLYINCIFFAQFDLRFLCV